MLTKFYRHGNEILDKMRYNSACTRDVFRIFSHSFRSSSTVAAAAAVVVVVVVVVIVVVIVSALNVHNVYIRFITI